jgi:hypothetical protein
VVTCGNRPISKGALNSILGACWAVLEPPQGQEEGNLPWWAQEGRYWDGCTGLEGPSCLEGRVKVCQGEAGSTAQPEEGASGRANAGVNPGV